MRASKTFYKKECTHYLGLVIANSRPPRRLRGGPPESAPADAAGTLTPAVLTSPLSARRPARTPCKPRRHGSDFRFRPASSHSVMEPTQNTTKRLETTWDL
ncbi:CDGSH iron-sulfur domain-containing protein 1 isoform X8 [Dipodomys merriami]|uniref:CDGSH iron-sulfur domain-containing protein 1 isoform X8 n=1 Tax=Dipodomys merriami TaxID=94247 RepID=UPI003855D719